MMDVRPMDRARRVGYVVAQTHLPEFSGDVQLYPETDGT
jgi:hypothetical protein